MSGRLIVFVIGPACAGKSKLGELLADRLGGQVWDTSDVIKTEYLRLTGVSIAPDEKETYRKELIQIGDLMTSRNAGRIVELILRFHRPRKEPLVVCGIRRAAEWGCALELARINRYEIRSIYLDRPGETKLDNFELNPADAGTYMLNEGSLEDLSDKAGEYVEQLFCGAIVA
jgi:hypothetical protein